MGILFHVKCGHISPVLEESTFFPQHPRADLSEHDNVDSSEVIGHKLFDVERFRYCHFSRAWRDSFQQSTRITGLCQSE